MDINIETVTKILGDWIQHYRKRINIAAKCISQSSPRKRTNIVIVCVCMILKETLLKNTLFSGRVHNGNYNIQN